MSSPGVCALHGRVQVVKAFAKYKIKVVTARPDLRVRRVTGFANNPGEWQLVSAFPDFTVEIVTAFPDFTVQWVSAYPGC